MFWGGGKVRSHILQIKLFKCQRFISLRYVCAILPTPMVSVTAYTWCDNGNKSWQDGTHISGIRLEKVRGWMLEPCSENESDLGSNSMSSFKLLYALDLECQMGSVCTFGSIKHS